MFYEKSTRQSTKQKQGYLERLLLAKKKINKKFKYGQYKN